MPVASDGTHIQSRSKTLPDVGPGLTSGLRATRRRGARLPCRAHRRDDRLAQVHPGHRAQALAEPLRQTRHLPPARRHQKAATSGCCTSAPLTPAQRPGHRHVRGTAYCLMRSGTETVFRGYALEPRSSRLGSKLSTFTRPRVAREGGPCGLRRGLGSSSCW